MKDSGRRVAGGGAGALGGAAAKAAPFSEITGGATPASGESSFWDGEVVWITPAELSASRLRLTSSARTLTEEGLQACSAEAGAPSGAYNVTARAAVGNVALAATEVLHKPRLYVANHRRQNC